MSQSQNPGDPYKALEEDQDLDLEVIGDIHATDIENHKEYLTDKYDSGDLDGILVTGDFTSSPHLGGQRDGITTPEEYKDVLDQNVSTLDEIGEELDVELYSVYGNHDPVRDAHPGKEEDMEALDNWLRENDDEFSEFDGNYYEFLTDQTDNVQDVSHSTVDIGDYTIVGGGSHVGPEVDPESLENAYETREVEIGDGSPKASDLVTGPLTGLATLGAAPFGKSVGGPKTVTEEYLPEEKREEFSDYFEKYDELEELIEEAGDNIIALDHGVPYGSGLDTVGGENKGSVVWRDLLKEHGDKIDGFVGGHFHGGGEAELKDVPIYNVGEGQYREFGIKDGEIDHFSYDWEDIGGEPPPEPETPQQPQAGGMEMLEQHAQQVPDERVPGDLVEEIMDKEGLDREQAFQKGKLIVAQAMQGTQQAQQPHQATGTARGQAGV